MNFNPKRVLLKLSGEAFSQDKFIEETSLEWIADQIIDVGGIELAIVVGGGNIFRGGGLGLGRVTGDQMGMLATVINGLALQNALLSKGIETTLQSAIDIPFAEKLDPRKAVCCIKYQVVIFVGGTGNPFVTTDTAAAIRASEIEADLLLKATKVEGIYSKDPLKNKKAQKINQISYQEFIERDLGVMDVSAVNICRQNRIPIVVFDFFKPGNLKRAVKGEVGTLIDI
jgi:uridylate kinase